MKINYNYLKPAMIIVGFLGVQVAMAQCPAITCPGNQTVNNAPGTCGAVVSYVTPVGTNPCASPVSQTFNYTGGQQTYVIPAGVTSIHVDAYGAKGGDGQNAGTGGSGGRIQADYPATPGQTVYVYVGGAGGNCAVCATGAFNGGGGTSAGAGQQAGTGGGASDIRIGGFALTDRKLVAGGGAGAGYSGVACNGGAGGNQTGATGNAWNGYPAGTGGTQIAGGAGGSGAAWGQPNAGNGTLGIGGNGQGWSGGGGGGGGGYYGGGGGFISGGGGGSSYADGFATNVVYSQGVQAGNGQVVISYLNPPTTTRTAGLASGSTFPVGVTTNTFQVNDGLGNTASCSFTVTVTDNQNPVITAPANITVNNAPGTCGAVVNFNAPVGTDNCVVTTARTTGLASGSTFPVGVTTQTYVATDASGNTGTCTFTVTVVDNETPVISCGSNIAVNNDAASCGAVVTYNAPTATDNCSVIVAQTSGMVSGSTFPIGVTTNTFTATDPAGLVSTCSFTVTVTDNELPSISCSPNVASCNPVVMGIAPTLVSDNCAGTTVTYTLSGATTGSGASDASGSTFNVGTTVVNYTATDASGNMNMCSFNVNVNPSYNNSATAAICQGGSIMLGGALQTQAGVYVDSLFSGAGCDSVVTTTLTVNPLPVVNLADFGNDSVCVTVAPLPLPAGTPSGGTYSGLGVAGGNFSPSVAGVGIHYVRYMYSDANGCKNIDSTMITVLTCVGIAEGNSLQPSVYPNPTNGQVVINMGSTYKAVEISVMELNGQVVKVNTYNYTSTITSDISELSTGMYFLQIKADGQTTMVKIVKN